jgi:lysophospholipase L1-like esterase
MEMPEAVPVRAGTSYDAEAGYGFACSPAPTRYEDLRDSWPGDYFVPAVPTFLVDVLNGNYLVKVGLGSADAATMTSVRAGQGQLMLHRVETEAGRMVHRTFSVHVDDGQLKLAFAGTGSAEAIQYIEIERDLTIPTIFLAGDSTVTDQPSGQQPYTGWGQVLPRYLAAGAAAVSNYARSGRSSKSFIDEDRLTRLWKRIRPGDYLLLQFGHNDEKDNDGGTKPFTTFQQYLSVYIDGALARGAQPVLISPMHRRFFDEEGRIRNTHGDYIAAMEQLAQGKRVPYINLAARSKRLFEQLGEEATKRIFMWLEPNRYAAWPDGTEDNTHFCEEGALAIAALVADGMRDAGLESLVAPVRQAAD